MKNEITLCFSPLRWMLRMSSELKASLRSNVERLNAEVKVRVYCQYFLCMLVGIE